MHPSPSRPPRLRSPITLVAVAALIVVAVGVSACGQPAAVPLRPTAVGAFPGDGTAGIVWGTPKDDADITSYSVTASPGHSRCSSHGKPQCTVTGLTNGHSYLISVRSVGDGGTSKPTTTTINAGVPWPPGVPSGVAGDTTATLVWPAPFFSGGAAVTSYQVTSSTRGACPASSPLCTTPTSHTGAATCTTTSLTCTVTGLTNDTAYTFTVVATNKYGASATSATSATITPTTMSGGSPGIVYLGPVNANQESTTGTVLQRDAGISVALPNGRDLWIFGDTSSFSADSNQTHAFIGGSTAAKGRYVAGRTPTALKDVHPASTTGSSSTAPSQFIPTPTDTYMPDGSGRPCTPANGAVYAARWPTGAVLLSNQVNMFVTYTDVCVTSGTNFTVEGWGFMVTTLKGSKIKFGPYDVFPPSAKGTPLPDSRAYQSPVVADGKVTMFTSACTSLYVACASGSVSVTSIADDPKALVDPANYVSQPATTDGTQPWKPVNISVASYPGGLRLIEQTSIGGEFTVFSSKSPTGPWHPFLTGTLPGCSTTPKGFCYAFVGHPELGSNSSLIMSYFKPDSAKNIDVGHVDLAYVPVPAP